MAKKTDPAPRLDPLRLHGLEEGDPTALAAGESYEGLRIAGADLTEWDLSGATFTECELVDWTVHDTGLRAIRLLETRLERLNAPVLVAPRATLRDVEIDGSRLGSAELYDAELERVVVSASKLGWLNLRSSRLEDVLFRGCRFDELDLGGATLARVAFEDCTVDRLVLHGARATHLDLRGLEVSAIDGIEGMRGARIGEVQAAAMTGLFAAHLGIEIAD
ncbi:pentapeptide repeat-containing protein [Schumannella luteola]|uniref:Pentapeptide repeat-containing protein n=1 Tax=Schumannella luteola TaxID=472059 RepID=A0A852Y7W2_9MICO|nr:pentapeptide repeat-containing protein [Schumannella luteola]NYG97394.1 hypothetical protein [Schumannella luteola]TPX01643.1 pentapeptide repeat-containing protein [Schumannella luteola]